MSKESKGDGAANPTVNKKRNAGYRFEKLKDQRLDAKEVQIPIPVAELEKLANEVTMLVTTIDEKEILRKETLPKQIADLRARLSLSARMYTTRQRPQMIDVAIGFDYEDREPLPALVDGGEPVPCPFGKKWFVNIKDGNVYGPEPITEKDMQVMSEALQAPPATIVEGDFSKESAQVLDGGNGKAAEGVASGEESEHAREHGARLSLRDSRKKNGTKLVLAPVAGRRKGKGKDAHPEEP